MTTVEILEPFYLKFDFLESQEPTYSSMMMKVSFKMAHYKTAIQYNCDLYFHFLDWDLFLEKLKNGSTTTLADMANDFLLTITQENGSIRFDIAHKETDSYSCRYELSYNTKIDLDTLAQFINKFEEFDKWW